MSESVLEKSLDDIIGEKKGGKFRGNRPSKIGKGNKQRFGKKPFKSGLLSSIPRDVASLAGSRQVLRVKNIHQELNGEDLSNLFSGVAPVEFVKFDKRDDLTAYVCFQENNAHNNSVAITKFDGRKAMGNVLVVENASSLADRIIALGNGNIQKPVNNRPPRGASKPKKSKKPRPVKKSVDDLDQELSAYMGGHDQEPNHEGEHVNEGPEDTMAD